MTLNVFVLAPKLLEPRFTLVSDQSCDPFNREKLAAESHALFAR